MGVREISGEFVEVEPGRFRWNGVVPDEAVYIRTVGLYRFLDGRVADSPFAAAPALGRLSPPETPTVP